MVGSWLPAWLCRSCLKESPAKLSSWGEQLCPSHTTQKYKHRWRRDHFTSCLYSLILFNTFLPTRADCEPTSNLRMEQAQGYWVSQAVKPTLRAVALPHCLLHPCTSEQPPTWLSASQVQAHMGSVAYVTRPFPFKQHPLSPQNQKAPTPIPSHQPLQPSNPQTNEISTTVWACP